MAKKPARSKTNKSRKTKMPARDTGKRDAHLKKTAFKKLGMKQLYEIVFNRYIDEWAEADRKGWQKKIRLEINQKHHSNVDHKRISRCVQKVKEELARADVARHKRSEIQQQYRKLYGMAVKDGNIAVATKVMNEIRDTDGVKEAAKVDVRISGLDDKRAELEEQADAAEREYRESLRKKNSG